MYLFIFLLSFCTTSSNSQYYWKYYPVKSTGSCRTKVNYLADIKFDGIFSKQVWLSVSWVTRAVTGQCQSAAMVTINIIAALLSAVSGCSIKI